MSSWLNFTVCATNDSIQAHSAQMHESRTYFYRKGRMEPFTFFANDDLGMVQGPQG
jgi:hypothetical protein